MNVVAHSLDNEHCQLSPTTHLQKSCQHFFEVLFEAKLKEKVNQKSVRSTFKYSTMYRKDVLHQNKINVRIHNFKSAKLK